MLPTTKSRNHTHEGQQDGDDGAARQHAEQGRDGIEDGEEERVHEDGEQETVGPDAGAQAQDEPDCRR